MNETFKNRLAEKLKSKGMKQKDLADALGVSEVTVSRWLGGERNPSMGTVEKIANVLGTTPAYLLSANELQPVQAEKKEEGINWGSILAGTAMTATAIIGLIALAKAAGKITEKDKQQIEDILNRD
ncbi:MAG: helix-turn-helix transcriptional regulator [Treponema sp.]|nr:helix-turn-helix transcriptional regulator [Treponema sp.]